MTRMGQSTTLTHRHTFSANYSSDRLLYNLLLKLDEYYSKPIQGLNETMVKKIHNVFMIRLSAFHTPIHSDAFAMDKQFCRSLCRLFQMCLLWKNVSVGGGLRRMSHGPQHFESNNCQRKGYHNVMTLSLTVVLRCVEHSSIPHLRWPGSPDQGLMGKKVFTLEKILPRRRGQLQCDKGIEDRVSSKIWVD
jgi:hypothetical protein